MANETLLCVGVMASHSIGRSIESNSVTWFLKRGNRAQNKDLVADTQTLLKENLFEKKSVESARRLFRQGGHSNHQLSNQESR